MIRRLIQLVIDRNAAQKAERETQESLRKGTDPKRPEQNLGRIRKALGGLRKVAVDVATAMGAVWAVKKVFDYAKAVFQLGADVRAVGSQFRTVFGQSTGAMNVFLEDFRRMAGLTRRESQRIAAGSGSMAQGFGLSSEAAVDFSERVLQLSGDLASFNNLPTADAAQLVQSALIGNTEAARSLQVSFTALDVQQRALANTGKDNVQSLTQAEKALAALDVMTERAGPQIGDLARTQSDADNQAKQLAGSFTNLKETLAAAVVGGASGSTIFGDLRDVFEDMTAWVEKNSVEIGHWSSLTIDVARAIGGTIVGVFNLIRSVADSVASYLVLTVRVWQEAFVKGADGVAKVINAVIEGLNKIPGVDIEYRINGMDVDHFERMRKEAAADLANGLGNVADALVQVGEGWVAVGRKALSSERDQGMALGGTGGGGGGSPAGPAATDDPDEELRRHAQRLEQQRIGDEAAQRYREEQLERLRAKADSVAGDMTSAFDDFFAAMADGFDGVEGAWGAVSELAQGVGQSIIAGLADGYADYHMAQGAGKLAEGTWPPNPAAIAAATQHFAAAGLFRALPALAGSAFGGGGSRGPSVGGPGPGAIGTSRPGVQNVMGSEINIWVDPLSPDDTRFQRVVFGAAQAAQERFGDKFRVNIRARTGG